MMLYFSKNLASYERKWKNDVQMTVWRMSMAFWVTKTTDTWLLYVILIAFSLQQWFYKLASVLHYTFTTSQVLDFLSFRFNTIVIMKQV